MRYQANRALFYLNTLYEFTHDLEQLRTLPAILQRMLRIVIGTGITGGLALMRHKGEEAFELAASENIDPTVRSKTTSRLRRQHCVAVGGLNAEEVSGVVGLTALPAPETQAISELFIAAGMKYLLTLQVRDRLQVVVGFGSPLSGKPLTPDQAQLIEALGKYTEAALGNAILYQGLIQENQKLKRELNRRYQFDNIIGQNPQMHAIYDQIQQAADYVNYSVLITGETGTGKELIARAIHHHSKRSGNFVAVNCAAIPEELAESELFGHEKGAFTGADRAKLGLFELANGGTIFLDEIGELSYEVQAKLLRTLQEQTVWRVGGATSRPIDVRVIAATNRDMTKEIADGSFREDVFHRFVIRIQTPPLRERKSDIPLLVESLLTEIAEENQRPLKVISTQALRILMDYDWPGNVRELQNVLRQAYMRTDAEVLAPQDILLPTAGISAIISNGVPLGEMVERFKRQVIANALHSTSGNRHEAARKLGISRQNLQNHLRRLKIG